MKPGRILFVAMLAFVVVVLAASGYFGAYVALGQSTDWRGNTAEGEPTDHIERRYQHRWMTHVFAPLASIEARCQGCNVFLTCRNDLVSPLLPPAIYAEPPYEVPVIESP
jgi:hypothetical protein